MATADDGGPPGKPASAPIPPADGKRRLPMAPRTEVAEPADEDRPPWHWSAIGAVGVFVFWLPLAYLVNGVIGARTGVAGVLLNAAAFVLACGGAGFLVGRFGGQAGRREAAVGGLAAAGLAWLVAALPLAQAQLPLVVTLALLLLAVAALGAGAGWAGGALGVRLRPR